MLKIRPVIGLVLSLVAMLCFNGFAVEAEAATSTSTGVAPKVQPTAPSFKTFSLGVDLRPSWTSAKDITHTENEIAAEYRFNPDLMVGYTQEFRSNLFTTLGSVYGEGTGLKAWDGYIKSDIQNVWVSSAKELSLSYEPRVYLPTLSDERVNGFQIGMRNYLKFSWKLKPDLELALYEIPIFYLYGQAGYEGPLGTLANRSLENRVELLAKAKFFNGALSFRVPIILQSIKFRRFETALNNSTWGHQLWIYPELIYNFSSTTGVGLSYYSENLAKEDLSAFNLDWGFSNGVMQIVLQQTI